MANKIIGSSKGNVVNYYSGKVKTIYTTINEWISLSLINDSLLTTLIFSVNNIQISVKPGEIFSDNFEEFTSISILNNCSYRLFLRR